MRLVCVSAAIAVFSCAVSAASAEPVAAPVPASAEVAAVQASAPVPASTGRQITLPSNSMVKVSILETLSTKKKMKLGDKFPIVTLADVSQDGQVVIPKNTTGEGSVSFFGKPGSFGKAGRLEISFDTLQLGGRTVAIAGKFRDQGKGNGGAATGALLAAGLVGGLFVHGHAAAIEKGEEMIAHTVDPITVDVADAAAAPAAQAVPAAAAAPAATPAAR